MADLGTFQVRGQPNVNLVVDRAAADRFGINVSDVQDAVETAVGGKPVSQILIGEQRYDLTVRYQERFRKTVEDIANIRILAPRASAFLWASCATSNWRMAPPPSIAREIRATSPSSTACADVIWAARCGRPLRKCVSKVQLPEGYHLDWTGEYESQQRANRRLAIIVPITLLLMSFILYSAFDSWKWVA